MASQSPLAISHYYDYETSHSMSALYLHNHINSMIHRRVWTFVDGAPSSRAMD